MQLSPPFCYPVTWSLLGSNIPLPKINVLLQRDQKELAKHGWGTSYCTAKINVGGFNTSHSEAGCTERLAAHKQKENKPEVT